VLGLFRGDALEVQKTIPDLLSDQEEFVATVFILSKRVANWTVPSQQSL